MPCAVALRSYRRDSRLSTRCKDADMFVGYGRIPVERSTARPVARQHGGVCAVVADRGKLPDEATIAARCLPDARDSATSGTDCQDNEPGRAGSARQQTDGVLTCRVWPQVASALVSLPPGKHHALRLRLTPSRLDRCSIACGRCAAQAVALAPPTAPGPEPTPWSWHSFRGQWIAFQTATSVEPRSRAQVYRLPPPVQLRGSSRPTIPSFALLCFRHDLISGHPERVPCLPRPARALRWPGRGCRVSPMGRPGWPWPACAQRRPGRGCRVARTGAPAGPGLRRMRRLGHWRGATLRSCQATEQGQ